MGPQRVLQAAAVLAGALAIATVAQAAPRERVAVIELGAPGAGGSDALVAALAAADLAPVTGDGLDAALAGRDVDADTGELAEAMAAAQRAFGALSCADAVPAAARAAGLLAARQAAGLAVPELPRAWTYLLLCADRDGKRAEAQTAASRLRAVGGSSDVPASVWAKYPPVDAVANVELIGVTIEADQPGAQVWVDFQPAGVAPVKVALAAGEHVIAAAAGGKRGWAAGTAVASQRTVRIALADVGGRWRELAARVASWRGERPSPSELAWVLGRVHARIAILRRGDRFEAWGQLGRAELPSRIGGDALEVPGAEVDRLVAAITDRIDRWAGRAPDPDRPLLVESAEERDAREHEAARPTKWWVYAAIVGAALVGGAAIYAHDSATDRQRVELHVP